MFTPYGRSTLVKLAAVSVGTLLFSILLPLQAAIPVGSAAAIFLIFSLWFFRDPNRSLPSGKGIVIAPADGTVMSIKACSHPFTGNGSSIISIFMSPLNVHVNRIPVTGTVTLLQHHPGSFSMAFDEKSGEENERMEIGIESNGMKLHFTQVAGFLARRIVCPLSLNEPVTAGKRFGMIKFGSRVDIVIPAGWLPEVKRGAKTRAGETIIARLATTAGNG
ncbi:phosphatidylserine decarboxylase [Chlorobium phaeovibrioides]|uniref:phosphatidylserine decarboxylase n=1 Tax=Chlorobium phaeovibrioides TaxID=1094 RepID=UPI000F8167C3|nr:phosphatidylserine decarboxylase [Chlorobium phaeovibrioides]RTY35878.1 phosphatidylserine decarboxylase [Chlorobium phaeovibrioides]